MTGDDLANRVAGLLQKIANDPEDPRIAVHAEAIAMSWSLHRFTRNQPLSNSAGSLRKMQRLDKKTIELAELLEGLGKGEPVPVPGAVVRNTMEALAGLNRACVAGMQSLTGETKTQPISEALKLAAQEAREPRQTAKTKDRDNVLSLVRKARHAYQDLRGEQLPDRLDGWSRNRCRSYINLLTDLFSIFGTSASPESAHRDAFSGEESEKPAKDS